jgi:L-galactonate dehydratase
VLCAGIRALAPRYIGRSLASIIADFGKTHRNLLSGQIRFMSPERGVMQLAANAVLNALWDLWAKVEGKPLWRLVADFTPEEFVKCIDFRYLTDAITPEEAIQMLKAQEAGKKERLELALKNEAVPGYNTSIGWLGLCE